MVAFCSHRSVGGPPDGVGGCERVCVTEEGRWASVSGRWLSWGLDLGGAELPRVSEQIEGSNFRWPATLRWVGASQEPWMVQRDSHEMSESRSRSPVHPWRETNSPRGELPEFLLSSPTVGGPFIRVRVANHARWTRLAASVSPSLGSFTRRGRSNLGGTDLRWGGNGS